MKRLTYRDEDGIPNWCKELLDDDTGLAGELIRGKMADLEDAIGDCDIERLKVIMTQCMSMREEVSERFRITGSIPVERLRELVEADKAGRCVVIPENYDGAMFRVWKNQILSSEKFAWMMKKLGKSFFLTHKAAEAALAKEK